MLNGLFKTSEIEKTRKILQQKHEQQRQEVIAKNNALCGCKIVDTPTTLQGIDASYGKKQIEDYDYTPEKLLFKDVSEKTNINDLFMGFEWEVEGGGKVSYHALNVKNIIGDDVAYTVHDGSLEGGFEIVTHPQTLHKHKTNAYKKAIEYLLANDYKDESNNAGLHIHVNRNYFGLDKKTQDNCIANICVLVENNWNFIKKVARRGDCEYSVRLDKDGLYKNNGFALMEKSKREGKYACINLQHDATVEFRMFKGTLNYSKLMASLELINNLSIIAKNTPSREIKDIKYDDIVNASDCPYLREFCKNNRIQL